MNQTPNPTLDEKIAELIAEYRKIILLCAKDLTNDKAISLAAYATIDIRDKLKALFAEHCKEIDRLARIDELEHVDRFTNYYPDDSEVIEVQERINQLKQENKI